MILEGGDLHRQQSPAQGPAHVQEELQNEASEEAAPAYRRDTFFVGLTDQGVFYKRLYLGSLHS